MDTRLQKSSIVALSLTVAVTAIAAGGSAYAQTGTQADNLTGRPPGLDVRGLNGPPPGGSLRPGLDGAECPGGLLRPAPAPANTGEPTTGQTATEEETAEPATDEASPADDPQAEADEG